MSDGHRFKVGDIVYAKIGDREPRWVVQSLEGSGRYVLTYTDTGKETALDWFDSELELYESAYTENDIVPQEGLLR